MLKFLSALPFLDWIVNLKYNPWKIARRNMIVAQVEHSSCYPFLGAVASKILGFAASILVLLISLLVASPLEFWMMRRGVKPWSMLKGRDDIHQLFLSAMANVCMYYLIGALLATIL